MRSESQCARVALLLGALTPLSAEAQRLREGAQRAAREIEALGRSVVPLLQHPDGRLQLEECEDHDCMGCAWCDALTEGECPEQ